MSSTQASRRSAVCRVARERIFEQGDCFASALLCSREGAYVAAVTSISTRASFGRRATWTVERAGGAAVK
jgi:hypothetical protein